MCVSIGMLSKSKGQILRVAACFHVLFHETTPLEIPMTLSEKAVEAGINFVDFCNQSLTFMAGRGNLEESMSTLQKGRPTMHPV